MAFVGSSARQIAQSLGTTRNAVIGRAYRTGVALPRPAVAKPKVYKNHEETRRLQAIAAKERHDRDPSWRMAISAAQKARWAKWREERA